MKVYISADMEGVVGAVTGDQLGPTGFEYQRFRRFLTNEVNAAIAAAREMGATEILVSDSHGNGENLLIEELPQDIQLIRSWPRPLMMMEGIDESRCNFEIDETEEMSRIIDAVNGEADALSYEKINQGKAKWITFSLFEAPGKVRVSRVVGVGFVA